MQGVGYEDQDGTGPSSGRRGTGGPQQVVGTSYRKVDARLPENGNSNSHGAGPVHLIIKMMKWVRTSRLSITLSLSGGPSVHGRRSTGAMLVSIRNKSISLSLSLSLSRARARSLSLSLSFARLDAVAQHPQICNLMHVR